MPLSNNGYGPVDRLAKPPVDLLICFAVKEEMKFFPCQSWKASSVQVWVTGIGRHNAAENIRDAIARVQPERVITAGFAGGLNPRLPAAPSFMSRISTPVSPRIGGIGRHSRPIPLPSPRRHHGGGEERPVAQTGADAVEMESSVIRTICREFKIPSATVRVISDDARQDLPLDFNALMTSDDRINYLKLMWAVLSRPSRIPKLIQFQHQTLDAARKLGAVLEDLLGAERR
jgi:adenosylhomocysteine nucleosidase